MSVLKYLLLLFLITACQATGHLAKPDLKLSITTALSKTMNKTSFATNDIIDIYQWTASDKKFRLGDFIYDGTAWYNNAHLLWESVDTPHFFIAMYPQTEMVFNAEQTGAIRYDIAKDSALLCARVLAPGRLATQGSVPLEFRYVASQLVVELVYGAGFSTTPHVISLTLKLVGTVAEQLSLTSDIISGDLSGFKDVLLYGIEQDQRYMTHIIPQQIGELELVLDYNGKKLCYQKQISLTLESGKTHHITFAIDL